MQPTHNYTEDELVKLLQARDKTAFTYLYEKYSGALYSIILQIMPGNSAAPDVLQDAFLNIWNKFESYDKSKGRLFTWMLALTRNLCIDIVRSRGYKNSRKNVDIAGEMEEGFYTQAVVVTMPDTINYIGLKKAVQKLQPQHRELINLAYFNGYTHTEIAGMEGLPKGTVKTRIRKALIELRGYLQ